MTAAADYEKLLLGLRQFSSGSRHSTDPAYDGVGLPTHSFPLLAFAIELKKKEGRPHVLRSLSL